MWIFRHFLLLIPATAFVPSFTPRTSVISNRFLGPEDEDCGDECEIDWSRMPGFDDNDDDDEISQDDVDNEDKDTSLEAEETNYSKSRLRLEMQWQATQDAEDCDVDQPETCGTEACNKCNGKGWNNCRFCQGTTMLRNMDTFRPCPICRDGVEPCHACAGTGLVAHFTTLKDGLEELNRT